MALRVEILNNQEKRIAVLDRFQSIEARKKINDISTLTFVALEDDIKIPFLQYGNYLEVYKNNIFLSRYIISERSRDKTNRTITVTAESEEVLLKHILLPIDYEQVFKLMGSSIQNILNRCIYNTHIIRLKDANQWNARVDQNYRTDVDTLEGLLILAEQTPDVYYNYGFFAVTFSQEEVPNFVKWDRVRWGSDFADNVKTFIRLNPNTIGHVFDDTEISGTLPSLIGYPANGFESLGVDAEIAPSVDVEAVLRTDDTDLTPKFTHLEILALTTSKISSTSISNAQATVGSMQNAGRTAFDVIKKACDQVKWQFKVEKSILYAGPTLGSDKSNEVILNTGGIYDD